MNASHDLAPVIDLRAMQAKNKGYYVVQPGDTIYFVAWRLDMDYLHLIEENHLKSPYQLQVGQQLVVAKQQPLVTIKRPLTVPKKKSISRHNATKAIDPYAVHRWHWPTQGKIIRAFSTHNKGINIAGKKGQSIVAAANGKVVYSGEGLPGYGKLHIIKNNRKYLTIYAHNQTLLVHTGQWVKGQQSIALMGDSDANRVMLHFEIRRYGKSVNPVRYLNSQGR
ncbi:MAG: peptidoglycan DD-metalloendopeptidase family protein [Gammaproteobacteria bacterium]|nr:peptidoglycan DD-metalloendopeptidase family protein [Gammaproteobacteria bacterium]